MLDIYGDHEKALEACKELSQRLNHKVVQVQEFDDAYLLYYGDVPDGARIRLEKDGLRLDPCSALGWVAGTLMHWRPS